MPAAAIQPSTVLVVGLGNPGPDYARTRHNLGALCVEELARRLGVELSRRRWRSLVAAAPGGHPGGGQLWLMVPQTMMNLSGRAVREALRDTGADPSSVWVVHDELDLPLCRLRIRRQGSTAGHNGLSSVVSHLGTDAFVRFRVGIGKPPSAARGVAYVLGRFSRSEAERLPAVVGGVASALEEALRSGLDRAMEIYNRPGSLGCEELL
jgi:peptidyl-tRNA hydrolase, PTH1 family